MNLENLKKRLLWQTAGLLVAAAIACPVLYRALDLQAALYARNEIPPALHKAARAADNVDDYINIAFVALALLVLLKWKNKLLFKKLLLPPLSSLAGGIVANILKPMFGRWRPKGYFNLGEFGFEPFSSIKAIHASFPSGHSTSIMALMTATALLFPRWRIPCVAIALATASARVFAGAHYPADVAAGLITGYLSARWLHYLLARKNQYPVDMQISRDDWRPRVSHK